MPKVTGLFGDEGEVSKATFSPCRLYRYTLLRRWNSREPLVNFVMLNPSTADESQDDPTIRRCIDYAKRWGYGGLIVTNLFAWRATDPRELDKHPEPVGPDNDAALWASAESSATTVAAWGKRGKLLGRGQAVLEILIRATEVVHAIRTNSDGSPCHPLYLSASVTPKVFWE